MLDEKVATLKSKLHELGKIAIAYSGGVDSSLLLKVAVDTLGAGNVLAITADSPVTPRSELERAQTVARLIGAQHLVVPSGEFSDARFCANTPERCYFCKRTRFQQLRDLAQTHGYQHLADGTNADDAHDYRPGTRAAAELGVIKPLSDSGMTKADIRGLSRILGLPTADLPSFACLASRIPYGTPLTAEILNQIEKGEEVLVSLGLRQYRLRHHGEVARIEVPVEDFPKVLDAREQIVAALRKIGYHYVALDLAGYRSGSMNEVLS